MGHMPHASHVATLHTNHGDIVINLYGDHAPKTVKNFIGLADGTQAWTHPATGEPGEGPLYKDVIFHRIIPNFMIQGGDPLGKGVRGPGYNFDDEINMDLNFNEPYILAMANAGLSSTAITGKAAGTYGSQFFVTGDPAPWLRGKHTIFGEVADVDANKVVDAVAAVPTAACDRPF